MTPKQIERFWKRVRWSDGCWQWTGEKLKGFGIVWIGKEPHQAHRIAYRLRCGPIPAGLNVYHSCRNQLCCKPEHLWVGTAADARRRSRKSRYDVQKVLHTLPDTDVVDIRTLHAKGVQLQVIAEYYGVHQSIIRSIVASQERLDEVQEQGAANTIDKAA